MSEKDQTIIMNLIRHTIEKHGCYIVDVDLDTQRVDIDGPSDEVIAECAGALADLLD